MQADEQIGPAAVGHVRPLFERDIRVALAGEQHFGAAAAEDARGVKGRRQGDGLLPHAQDARGAGVVAAVPGVDDDAPERRPGDPIGRAG